MIPAQPVNLSEIEISFIPHIKAFFQRYPGREYRIKSEYLRLKLQDIAGAPRALLDMELQNALGFMRREDMLAPGFILSDNKGYWYSEDEEEQMDTWQTQMDRATCMLKNFAPIYRRYKINQNQLIIDL